MANVWRKYLVFKYKKEGRLFLHVMSYNYVVAIVIWVHFYD